jgi:ZIP family zinc transporter
MIGALLWGLFASGSLLLGAVIAVRRPPHPRGLGLTMAFGSGVLLSAVSFELVEQSAVIGGGSGGVIFGLFAGAGVFTLGDVLIGRFERRRKRDLGAAHGEASGLSILLGALLDGIPETAVLGLTLVQEGAVGMAMLVAVFVSNIPEGVAATTTLIEGGWERVRVLRLWAVVVVACGLASALGFLFLDSASPAVLAFVYAFAGGAVLTMLATSMMPEAFERAGRAVGFVTVVGFFVAYAIHLLEG